MEADERLKGVRNSLRSEAQESAFGVTEMLAHYKPRFCFCPTTEHRRAAELGNRSKVVSLRLRRTLGRFCVSS